MNNNNQIIHYDLADMAYSSFFLTGFFQNEKKYSYKFVITKRQPSLLEDSTFDNKWKEISFSICLFRVKLNGAEFYFCIDTRDSATTQSGAGYYLPLLNKVKYYFKVNYNEEIIKADPNLMRYSDKIIAVPLFFPLSVPNFSLLLSRNITDWNMKSIRRNIGALRHLLSLNEILQLREVKKDLDLFFVVKPYGERHLTDDEFRYQIIRELKSCHYINSIVGFSSNRKLPGKFEQLRVPEYTLQDYLRNLSRAKIAIYIRGLHNCLSFKFGQLLALGKPIVGQTIFNNKEELYKNQYFPDQFAFDNPNEIVQAAIELLNSETRMKIFGESNSRIFDAKYTPQIIVSNILKCLIR